MAKLRSGTVTDSVGPKRRYKRKATKKDNNKEFKKEVKAIVKKEIHKNAEDKMAYNSNALTAYNGVLTAADVYQAAFPMPNIAEGTSDNDRIGVQLRGKKLNIKGHFLTTISYVSNSTYARLGVRLMIVQPKSYASQPDVINHATNWLAGLLKKGGTSSNFNGLIQDLYAPINTDLITKYYDKLYYINTPYYLTAEGGLDNINICKFFDINLKVKGKTFKYDANIDSGLTPVNWAPVMLICYAKLDGGAADSINTAINLASVTTFTYEDS